MIEAHPMTSEIQSDVAKPVLRAACSFISAAFAPHFASHNARTAAQQDEREGGENQFSEKNSKEVQTEAKFETSEPES